MDANENATESGDPVCFERLSSQCSRSPPSIALGWSKHQGAYY